MRKVISTILSLFLIIGFTIPTMVSATTLSEYENILNSINKEFNLELGYVPVDESKVTLEEYESYSRKIAEEQRELLDYINSRENNEIVATISSSIQPRAIITRTANTWVSNHFNITLTYDVNSNKVSNLRNAKLGITTVGILANSWIMSPSGPSYSILDGGRTAAVKYTATVHYNSLIGYKNTTLYSEFYYNS